MSKRKPYQRPITATWWMSNPFFVRYIIREGSSIFVMLFSLELFYGLYSVSLGEHAWSEFVSWLVSPGAFVFHFVCLIATLIHSITWFQLAPKTMDLWIKGKKVNDGLISKAHLGVFIITTIVLIVLIGAYL